MVMSEENNGTAKLTKNLSCEHSILTIYLNYLQFILKK